MFGRRKIACVLLCASIFGRSKTSAFGLKEFFITSGVLLGSYLVTNEVVGDTGLVSHPALGGFTAKKTLDYLTRDVKKEKELIDDIINAFSTLTGGGRLIGELEKLASIDGKQVDKSKIKINDLKNNAIKETKSVLGDLFNNKGLLSRVKIDSWSISGRSLDDSMISELKGMSLMALWVGIISLFLSKNQLNKIGFVDYSLGCKFDHSAKSVRLSPPDGKMVFTLNNDNSLKFNFDGKDPNSKKSMKLNMTILSRKESKESKK